jgi:hypothetical protein
MLERSILVLYLAHLLTDFVLQTADIVQQKQRRQIAGYCKHGAILFAYSILIGCLCIPGAFLSPRFYAVVLGLALVHLLIDFGKISLAQVSNSANGVAGFVADQLLHLLTVVLAGFLIARVPVAFVWSAIGRPSDRALQLLVVYVAVIFGGGYLIRALTAPLMQGVHASESNAKLKHAGMYIGWLERFVALTALLLHSPATIGLIMAAKSIARYPEFKNEHFAEYFLIGTLLSISIALLGGVILLKAFYGSVTLAQ